MVIVGVYTSVTFWDELLLLVKAGVGPLLVLIGAFIVWLESDEWKMQRETEEAQGIQRQLTAEETVTEEEEEEDEDEGFECAECGKSFDTERGLHIHQAQKHE